jgi:serine/threonine protein kinase
VPWSQLQLHDKLGEGASGVIHRASWQPGGEVAVKLFKGTVTSDGSPHSEMAACIHAGGHAGLIPLHGRIAGHPHAVEGLVLALVEAHFRNLAGPPSLASCTRDIYAEGTHFSRERVLGIASGIAATAEHLHARGLMHGDLYAHNMLHDGDGTVLLGDFGAASFHAGAETAAALERIEVRAFACLLEELLQRCTAEAVELQALWALQQCCAGEEVSQRPTFAEIGRQLQAISRR